MTSVMVNILSEGTSYVGMESMLITWMKSKPNYKFGLFTPTARPISNNRNTIVRDFLRGNWDYLCMIDDDNPPRKNPFDLLDFDKDVIGAIYPGWSANGLRFHIYKFGKDYPKKITFNQYVDGEIKGLSKVDAIGTGCIFIKRHVLEKIKRPFEDMFDENGLLLHNDDMAFSLKCKKAGIDIWTHSEYMCSHYKIVDLLEVAQILVQHGQNLK